MTGELNTNGYKIKNLATPRTYENDSANFLAYFLLLMSLISTLFLMLSVV